MNNIEYDKLIDMTFPEHPRVHIEELTNRKNRTLLWGYTSNRDDWHVFIRCGMINLYSYNFKNETLLFDSDFGFPVKSLIPDKRLYPEACDFEFCCLLKQKGIYLPFTRFNPARETSQYYGERYCNVYY